MTEERKKEIKNEAVRRFKLRLMHKTFDELTCDGSFILFNMQLALFGSPFNEHFVGRGDFKKFVTNREFHSKEYDKIVRDLFNHYYNKYSKYGSDAK